MPICIKRYVYLTYDKTFRRVSMSKKMVLLIVLAFFITNCGSSGTAKTTIPVSSRLSNMLKATYSPVAGIHKDTLYVLFGSGNTHIHKYKIATDRWELMPSLTDNVNNAAYTVYKDKIFIFGGWENLNKRNRNKALYFDMNKEKIRNITPLPYVLNGARAVVFNKKIYICGGWINKKIGTTNAMLVYNPEKNRYSYAAPMPRKISSFGIAAVKKGIYVFGGSFKGNSKEAYHYDGKEWKQIADLPYPLAGFAAVGIGKYIYIIGGSTGYSVHSRTLSKKNILRYDTEKDIYEKIGTMVIPRNALAVAKNINNDIYSIAGPDNRFWTPVLERHRLHK